MHSSTKPLWLSWKGTRACYVAMMIRNAVGFQILPFTLTKCWPTFTSVYSKILYMFGQLATTRFPFERSIFDLMSPIAASRPSIEDVQLHLNKILVLQNLFLSRLPSHLGAHPESSAPLWLTHHDRPRVVPSARLTERVRPAL